MLRPADGGNEKALRPDAIGRPALPAEAPAVAAERLVLVSATRQTARVLPCSSTRGCRTNGQHGCVRAQTAAQRKPARASRMTSPARRPKRARKTCEKYVTETKPHLAAMSATVPLPP
jgi:hypothetical protein